MNIPRNIIFDGQSPMAVLGSPPPIPAPQTEAIIDLNWVNYFLSSYLIILIGQYVCIFMSVPFDDVINRPSISILSSFYDGIMFTLCCCIFPLGSVVPSLKCLFYLTISCLLQLVGLLLSVPTTIYVLNVESMYSYEYDCQLKTSMKVNVTLYFQIVTCLTLVFHCMGFLLALFNCVLAYQGLSNLNNRIDRRSQSKTCEFPMKLSDELFEKEAHWFRG